MAFHPDSIRKMTGWRLIDARGGEVATEADIRAAAILERKRPYDIAKREAKLRSDPVSGIVTAVRATDAKSGRA
ncbi:MAG: hypothetical protein F9K30_20005 [Dechloromonas sp.]|nr:MAG: hypothetical protein F9K30_20005 [Dechloromonas sp.]